MTEALPAIRLAEDFLLLAFEAEDEEIDEALAKLGTIDATYGVLWGAGNIRTSGMDLDLYNLKAKVLRFVREVRADKRFGLVLAIHVGRAREES